MNKAIIFPYSKETRHFIEWTNECIIEVSSFISPQILGMGMEGLDKYKWYSSFDSAIVTDESVLIVGYTNELNTLRKKDYLLQALQFALEYQLDLFAFDDIYIEKYSKILIDAKNKGLIFYSPQIKGNINHSIVSNEIYSIQKTIEHKKIPHIMILGTSSRQGKFTLMMQLKQVFKENAFYIGTEHHSQLFGINVAFPYGVQGGVQIPLYEYENYLSQIVNEIEPQYQMIISCAQSGILPFAIDDGINKGYTLATISFFLSLNPSHVILTINPYFDTDFFIERTIGFINSTGDSKVICLAFSDINKNDNSLFTDEKISEIKRVYSSRFNLKCLCIKKDDWLPIKDLNYVVNN